MPIIGYILIAVLGISLISLVGVFSLAFKESFIKRIPFILVAFSAGTLLAAAFLDILPEVITSGQKNVVFIFILLGIVVFFIMEKFLYWSHCHNNVCQEHTLIYLNLFGDGLHNFIDGVIIASSFLISIQLGVITTLAIVCHELPQEIGDFGILIYGGLSRKKALLYNFLCGLTAVIGAVIAYFFNAQITGLTNYILAFAAGGFIYIACADIIPQLHKEYDAKSSILQVALIIFGIFIIWVVKVVFRAV